MVNALKLLESANHHPVLADSSELGIKLELFESIAKRCGFFVIHEEENGRRVIRLKKKNIPLVKLYSREESPYFHFLDISDLHVGNEQFEEEKLCAILEEAVNREVKEVFIAGDLFEAIDNPQELDFRILNAEKIQSVMQVYKKQLRKLFRIFKRYDLSYHAICGNHEYAFEQLGIMNPVKELERKLMNEGIDFRSYDTYLIDFEIAGIIKRVIHLESYFEHKKGFPALERLKEFEKHGGLNVHVSEQTTIPIRFLECGHVHIPMELYSSKHNVYITQPGSFLERNLADEPGIFVRGEVTPKLNIIRY